jgi:ADP-heptose:LPS heptosyltransferase
MFDHIHKKYAGVPVYVLLFRQNREAMELIGLVPRERIFSIRNTSFLKFFLDSIRVLIQLRKLSIDAVIDCELFTRISSLYSLLCGSKLRAAFHRHTQEGLFRGNFINRPVPYNPYQHISHQFITLAEALESNDVPAVKRRVSETILQIPPLNFNRDEIERTATKFARDFPECENKKIVLVYPGGGILPIRAWPRQYFTVLIRDLAQSGHAVGITGLPEDKELAAGILSESECPNCMDLTGYTKSVKELAILFHLASLLITNDGGPGHLAAMTPLPSIILFGPETPLLYRPLSTRSYCFHVPLSCSPCLTAYNHRNSPCDGDNQCLKRILPKDVLKKAYPILDRQGIPLVPRPST